MQAAGSGDGACYQPVNTAGTPVCFLSVSCLLPACFLSASCLLPVRIRPAVTTPHRAESDRATAVPSGAVPRPGLLKQRGGGPWRVTRGQTTLVTRGQTTFTRDDGAAGRRTSRCRKDRAGPAGVRAAPALRRRAADGPLARHAMVEPCQGCPALCRGPGLATGVTLRHITSRYITLRGASGPADTRLL
jgi:hypothetical protein